MSATILQDASVYMGTYLLLIIVPLMLGIWAQAKVMSAYSKWSKVRSRGNLTGAEAAGAILKSAGIDNVEVVAIEGHLTDHYDPASNRLCLSNANYHGTSLAALGVSAHEAGHALQHYRHYAPLKLRMILVPVTQVASIALPFIILGGFFLQLLGLIKLAVVAYLILTFFQLVTLPVEFDASRRAKRELVNLGILDEDESVGVNETLDAAGLTYVAAFVASLANLVHFLLMVRRED